MPEVQNFFIASCFCPHPAITSPTSTHLDYSGLLDTWPYNLIAVTSGLALLLLITRTLAEESSYLSDWVNSFLNFPFLPLLCLTSFLTTWGQHFLKNSSSHSKRLRSSHKVTTVDPTSFFLPFFFSLEVFVIFGISAAIIFSVTQEVFPDPRGDEVVSWFSSLNLVPLNDPDISNLPYRFSGSCFSLHISFDPSLFLLLLLGGASRFWF